MKKNKICFLGISICLIYVLSSCEKPIAADSQKKETFTNSEIQTDVSTMLFAGDSGPVTAAEIADFKTKMNAVNNPPANDDNIWVFGTPGKAVEACGLMYEATQDIAILNRMIYYCDAILAGRNDLASAANGGQRTVWSGNIEPVWPSSAAGVSPAAAGIEQGYIVGRMALCAKQILSNPAIWNTTVTGGDPNGFGATYKARAIRYMQEGDHVMNTWIIPRFVRTSDKKLYFPGAPNTYKPNQPAPWNQLFMVTDGMIRLLQCHLILNDAPAQVTIYDNIVQPNITWFRSNLTANTSASGSACWKYPYQLTFSAIEDANHYAYDVQGMWIAYNSGRYNVTLNDMKPFANTYFDIVLQIVTNGKFAGRIDGTTGSGNSGGDNYVRDEYFYLADIRPEKYTTATNIEVSSGADSRINVLAKMLWLKKRRYQTLNVTAHGNCNYGGWAASFQMGDYNTADIVSRGGLNDGMSSLKVPPGLKVIVYTGSGFTGTSKTFTADDACLIDDGINDQISSLKVMSN